MNITLSSKIRKYKINQSVIIKFSVFKNVLERQDNEGNEEYRCEDENDDGLSSSQLYDTVGLGLTKQGCD
jgi:hypothetical protein